MARIKEFSLPDYDMPGDTIELQPDEDGGGRPRKQQDVPTIKITTFRGTAEPGKEEREDTPPIPVVKERYKPLSYISKGGQGQVWKGYDDLLKRQVALKFLTLEHADEETKDRFIREARVAAQLEHQNIARVYDFAIVELENMLSAAIVEQLIEGRSLAGIVEGRKKGEDWAKKYTDSRLVDIFYSACQAIEFAHMKGVIHRDIKPANVMTGDAGTFVIDFGLGIFKGSHERRVDRKTRRHVVSPDTQLTEAGATVGTPNYMPPEQARGERENLDERSDVYSLGATLYELLAGRSPFGTGCSSAYEVLDKVLNEEAEPISKFNPFVPLSLEVLVRKAMAKRKKDRFQSVRAFCTELDRLREGMPEYMEQEIDRLIESGNEAEALKLIMHGTQVCQKRIEERKSANMQTFYESLRLADIFRREANVHRRLRDSTSMRRAAENAIKAGAEATEHLLKTRARDLLNAAYLQESKAEALEKARQGTKIIEGLNDPKLAGWARLVESDIFFLDPDSRRQDLQEAERLCREAYNCYRGAKDAEGMSRSFYALCDVLAELSPEKVLRFAGILGDKLAGSPDYRARKALAVGKSYTRLGEWESAALHLNEALSEGKATRHNGVVAVASYNLGIVSYFHSKDEKLARSYMEEARKLGMEKFVDRFWKKPANRTYELG